MKKIVALFVLILTFCGCENSSEPSLEERFSCKVDGKLFVAAADSENPITGSKNLSIDYSGESSFSPYYLSITASGKNEGVSVGCKAVTKTGTYPINSAAYDRNAHYFEYKEEGTVTIYHLDTIAKKIAGTFQFTAEDRNGIKVTISEGKFNHIYKPSY
ncbi:MAG: DUF6252 family protein [Bacteroidota bacterium]